ncbi:Excalibur calcium-binding domain containing protein [Acidimicrobiia bacterium]
MGIVALVVLALGACGSGDDADRRAANSTLSAPTTSVTSKSDDSATTSSLTVPSPVTSTSSPGASANPSVRDQLAALRIDDRPNPVGDYRREDWSHWDDIDGNGCDARQDALIAWSTVAATVNRAGTCKTITGWWVSPYDLVASANPGDFDVDHLVPLADAFESGGWQWSAAKRRQFANNQAELVVASASSNRSKGADSPDEWRPPNPESWCAYATGWLGVKVTWDLTATTNERNTLGQMLDTCTLIGLAWPRGGEVVTTTSIAPAGPGTGGGDAYYANCTAARAAGAAPIYLGQPGYRSALDGDKDGVACE